MKFDDSPDERRIKRYKMVWGEMPTKKDNPECRPKSTSNNSDGSRHPKRSVMRQVQVGPQELFYRRLQSVGGQKQSLKDHQSY